MSVAFGAHQPVLVIRVAVEDDVKSVQDVLDTLVSVPYFPFPTPDTQDRTSYHRPELLAAGKKLTPNKVVLDFSRPFKDKAYNEACEHQKVHLWQYTFIEYF
jgi:hypothetical protein